MISLEKEAEYTAELTIKISALIAEYYLNNKELVGHDEVVSIGALISCLSQLSSLSLNLGTGFMPTEEDKKKHLEGIKLAYEEAFNAYNKEWENLQAVADGARDKAYDA